MNNLVLAGIQRLKKSSIFFAGLLSMLAVTVYYMLTKSNESTMFVGQYYLDNFYFDIGPFMGVFCAVFISLFIGTEYSDGVIRNKIIVGHSRTKVYLSNFIVSLIACESFVLMWIIGGLVGIPQLGWLNMGYEQFIVYIILSLLYTGALTSIFLLFSMLSSNKTINVVIEMLFATLLILISSTLLIHLQEPAQTTVKIIENVSVDLGGTPFANPAYVDGTLREFFQLVVDSLPTGQALLMMESAIYRPVLSASASVLIIISTLFIGCISFNKKDLK